MVQYRAVKLIISMLYVMYIVAKVVSLKLDYRNSVLSETFLQHVQNTVARDVAFDGDLKI